jgi:hypothetical protein
MSRDVVLAVIVLGGVAFGVVLRLGAVVVKGAGELGQGTNRRTAVQRVSGRRD